MQELSSDLYNNEAQAKQHREKSNVPKPMDDAQCELHAQICGVLTPHLVGTRILEHDTADMGASCYLPMWKGLMWKLGPEGTTPRPENCGPLGRQETGKAYYDEDELLPLTKRLRRWLGGDGLGGESGGYRGRLKNASKAAGRLRSPAIPC